MSQPRDKRSRYFPASNMYTVVQCPYCFRKGLLRYRYANGEVLIVHREATVNVWVKDKQDWSDWTCKASMDACNEGRSGGHDHEDLEDVRKLYREVESKDYAA